MKNTVVWISADGEVVHRYQKIHLFDVDIQNGPVLKESRYVLSTSLVSLEFT